MAAEDSKFDGSIPELYDTYLVPLVFETYAADLAERAAASNPATVLEVAAGSGVVTRALANRLHDNVRVTVTDLNQPMLDHAASRQADDARFSWQAADAQNLPFADGSFDALICQFGVMFFPDRPAAFREARRVLTPTGRFMFNVWDEIEQNEFAHTVTAALAEVFPDDPPLFMARTPHGYHDTASIEQDLRSAGFGACEFETLEALSSAPSAKHVAIAYCQGTPLRNEIEARDADKLAAATEHAARAIADKYGDAEVNAKIQGIVVTAHGGAAS